MIANSYIRNSKSWNAFSSKLNSLIVKNKKLEAGKIYEKCVQLFLQTNPKYQSELKHVWLLEEVPKNIRLKLKLPVADEGIDLIAETYRKEYWAIQAKYKTNKDSTLTRKDLSTFRDLAFVTCKNIIHGLVCSPISSEPRKAELMNKTGFALVDEWEALDDNKQYGWKAIQKKLGGKAVKPEKFSPKKHQQQAIKSVLKAFKDKSTERGKMIMPCGTGKSLTAFWIARDMKVKNILVAIPSLSLLQQTLNVWTKEFLANNIRPDYLCVCSDESAGSLEKDEFTSQTYDMGIRTTTDQQTIESFLKNKSNNIKIIFTTYQSGQVTAKASKKTKIVFDLGIMDEAHKTVGHKLKPMAHLIHEKNIKIKKRLFMTATERVYHGGRENEILSMDDSKDYGNLVFQMTYKEAIDQGLVTDYKIVSFDITKDDFEEAFNENQYIRKDKREINSKQDATMREMTTAVALRKSFKKLNIKKSLSFHSSIKRAEYFENINNELNNNFKKYPKIETFHVSSKQNSSERLQEMKSFEMSKTSLMTNARCLTEGVDIPSIDCVAFIDSKKSKVDIVQAAGRAMRLNKNKKYGYILVPIITNDEDLSTASIDTEFEDLINVITSLATQDKRIVDEIKLKLGSSAVKRKKTNILENLTVNKLKKIDPKEIDKNIYLKVWNNIYTFAFCEYEDASNFIKKFNLQTVKDFQDFCKSDKKPLDIPYTPERVYKNRGWKSWGDFLGTNRVSNLFRKDLYLPYKKAEKYVRKLKIPSQSEWGKYVASGKKPLFLPSHPHVIYKNKGWNGMSQWLGNQHIQPQKRNFKSFEDVRDFYRKLFKKNKLKYSKDIRKIIHRIKIPDDIPKAPYSLFKNHPKWINEAEFFGLEVKRLQSYKKRKFKDARKFALSLQLKNKNEWMKLNYTNSKPLLPYDIPRLPSKFYKEWKSWNDWLGTNYQQGGNFSFISFEELKKLLKKNNISSKKEYGIFYKKNKDKFKIPNDPLRTKFYKNNLKTLKKLFV
jgi:superfamily II DNA or RNA helicase